MHASEKFASADYRSSIQGTEAVSPKFDWLGSQLDSLALREKDEFLLLREMHHRLANTLTVLTSALRCEFARSAVPELQDSLARYEARIVAFGNLHRSLLVGAADGLVSVPYYIEHLCEALSEALLKPLGVGCEVFAEAGECLSERCERLGLVVAELVTNAAKHAFHGRENGRVRVKLINRGDCWVCIVSDNGIGSAMAPSGIGTKILEQLVGSLGGALIRKSKFHGTSVFVTCQL
jgi:two-component sensor histidine kinase